MHCRSYSSWLCIISLAICIVGQHAAAPQLHDKKGKPLVVAHRGASGLLPEHTREAYLEAIKEGADFIECCDVVVTKDLQLVCRHEPEINGTTDAWDKFRDRVTTKTIDGEQVRGIFTSDLTLNEVKTLKAKQRLPFRDQSFNGKFDVLTLSECIDVALGAGRPVGIYPESKHPTWHNNLPFMKAANTTIEDLIVKVINSKGYATSAPFNSAAWGAKPIFLQSFEVTSLERFSKQTLVPLAYLLDAGKTFDTGLALTDIVVEPYLKNLKSFVTVMAPGKDLLYTVQNKDKPNAKLQSKGYVERFHKQGFQVHIYTLRDEKQYVIPTCPDIQCEFRWWFDTEGVDGAFADYPATLIKWLKANRS